MARLESNFSVPRNNNDPLEPIKDSGTSEVTVCKSKMRIGGYLAWDDPTKQQLRALLAAPPMAKVASQIFSPQCRRDIKQDFIASALAILQNEESKVDNIQGYSMTKPFKDTMDDAIAAFVSEDQKPTLVAAVIYHLDQDMWQKMVF